MLTYIRNNIKGYYIEVPEEIDAEYWAGKIGSTYQDFLDGKWVLLSAELLAFHEEHPSASIKEVLDILLTPEPERTLEQAKALKIEEIELYDNSNNINSFDIVINGETISAWITPDQRSNYKNSIDSAELLDLEEVHPVFNGVQLTLSISMAKMALAQIQIYADRCYNVTEMHKIDIKGCSTLEEVDSYDIRSGYPNKLTFTI